MPAGSEDLDYEDELPAGQAPIVTKSVDRIHTLLDFVMHSHELTGYSCNGVVTGAAGLGKTIAIRAFLDRNPVRTHTGLPACVRVKVGPKSNARTLAGAIAEALNYRPRSKRVNTATDDAVAAVHQSDLHLLLIDEADGLDVLSFEMLRRVYDRTGCPIVLVGLPTIYAVIEAHEKYESRIGMFVGFDPMSEAEVLDLVLPQMSIPAWSFDPHEDADRQLGQRLWTRVHPSFRKLRVVLTNASQFAQQMGDKLITMEHLELAMAMSLRPQPAPSRRTHAGSQGSYERASEERHAGKQGPAHAEGTTDAARVPPLKEDLPTNTIAATHAIEEDTVHDTPVG